MSRCPHEQDPRGCYRVRCQLGRVCVEAAASENAPPAPTSTLASVDERAAMEFYALNPSAALFDLRRRLSTAAPSADQVDGMCPNCVTPWNCNGPHIAAPTSTPTTECTTCGAIVLGVAEPSEPVAWGQLGMLNGRSYLRSNYDRTPYPPPADIVRNLNLVPLYAHPAPAEPTAACVEAMRGALAWIEADGHAEGCGDHGRDDCGCGLDSVLEALRAQIEQIGGGR